MNLSDLFGTQDISWMDEASCMGIEDPEIFYPPRDKDVYKETADEAKLHCFGDSVLRACPVRQECLWYAVSSDEQHGIWGGMSHRERNALVRKWQKQFKSKMTLKEYIFQLEKKGK